ncbi:MAG: hypothetical protein QOJ09_3101, partial [Actinomycetota bacterium]|nr:hypothetical protein [Actinomycetota bacterium]
ANDMARGNRGVHELVDSRGLPQHNGVR